MSFGHRRQVCARAIVLTATKNRNVTGIIKRRKANTLSLVCHTGDAVDTVGKKAVNNP